MPPTKLTTGTALLHARNLRGITLAQLAKSAGVDLHVLTEIERDKKTLDVDLAVRLTSVLSLGDPRILLPNHERTRVYDGALQANGMLMGTSGAAYLPTAWIAGFEGKRVRVTVEVVEEKSE